VVEVAGPLGPYVSLIESFVASEIDGATFEARFLELYKNDDSAWTPAAFDVLDGLFAEVDDFTPYPELRDPGDPTEDDFRAQAERRLQRLLALDGSPVRG